MRLLACAAVGFGLSVLAAPARSDEIYRWTDAAGRVHYANTGSPDPARAPDVPSSDAAAAPSGQEGDDQRPGMVRGAEPGQEEAAAPKAAADGADQDDSVFSTQASLRRAALEKDLRATNSQIRNIEGRLADLARVRARNARGTAATGGVASNMDVRSDEEQSLAEQRDQLVAHASEVRADYGKLREEVVSQLGAAPAWWIEVH